MTKADIINDIAEKTGIEKVAVQASVEAFMKSVRNFAKQVLQHAACGQEHAVYRVPWHRRRRQGAGGDSAGHCGGTWRR